MIGRIVRHLIFPPKCVFCRELLPLASKVLICKRCIASLPYLPQAHCPICGRVTATGAGECFACHTAPPKFQSHRSVLYYRDTVRSALLRFKFYGKRYYAIPFSMLMSASVSGTYDLITAVPVSEKRYRERGYDQSRLLAKRIGKFRGIPYVQTLQKIKDTPPQSTLSYALRAKNVRGAFQAVDAKNIKGKRILLIDDIFTTGATAGECASVLRKAKAERVDVLTLAMAEPKGGGAQ